MSKSYVKQQLADAIQEMKKEKSTALDEYCYDGGDWLEGHLNGLNIGIASMEKILYNINCVYRE